MPDTPTGMPFPTENAPQGAPAGATPDLAKVKEAQLAFLKWFAASHGQGKGGAPGGGNPTISPAQKNTVMNVTGGGGTTAGSPMMQHGMPGGAMPGGAPAGGSPLPGVGETGFSFPNKKAAQGATAYGIMSNIIQTADKVAQKHDKLKQNESEYLLQTYYDALNRQDYDSANAIAADPKFRKLIKAAKGIDLFTFGDQEGQKKPEDKAVQGFMQKLAAKLKGGGGQQGPAPNMPMPKGSPQAQLEAQQRGVTGIETANKGIAAGAANTALSQDQTLARNMGLGTALSGDEQKKAELAQAGLWMPPGAIAEFGLKARQLDLDSKKIDQDYMLSMAEMANRKDIAKIQQGPEYERNKILRENYKGMLSVKTLLADGKHSEAYDKMYKVSEDAYTKLSNQATTLIKSGKAPDDPAVKVLMDAANNQKQAMDDAKAAQDLQLIQGILGGK